MTGRIATQRRLRSLCLAAVACWLAASAAVADGLIYRVSREAAEPSFLVGTMHSDDPRVTAQLAGIAPLIAQVELVAIELVPDAVTLVAIGAATLLPLDQSLRALIGEDRFLALEAVARERDLPTALLDRLKPWAAAVTVGLPGSESGRFLDMEIYLEALRQERRVVGLESAAEQLAVFDGMTLETQLLLLDDTIKNAHLVPTQLESLLAAYLDGDLDALDSAARAQYADMPPAIATWFERRLLEERNARMLARLARLLEAQPLLVAVGALHLGGDEGLVAGLRRLGYRVEPWRG